MISSVPLVAFADVNDLLVASDSNALASSSNAIMTLELDDGDYGVSVLSSIGTVKNTIDSNSLPVSVQVTNGSGDTNWINVVAYLENDRYVINRVTAPSGYYVTRVQPTLYSKDIPSAGTYLLSFDYASDISYDVSGMSVWSAKYPNNVADQSNVIPIDSFADSSGEVYVAPMGIRLTNLSQMAIVIGIKQSEYVSTIGGSFAINFTAAADNDSYPSTAGSNTSSSDYQSDVSSSLSGISSGMSEQAESIQNVADAITSLSESMEPHYGEVLTQLHHITEQLHAFWDQQYNLHHVPLMAKLDAMVTALSDMDSGLGGKIDTLISTVQTAGQDIYSQLNTQRGRLSSEFQKKVQAVGDEIRAKQDEVQEAIDSSIEEHGNFIIEGLKGLFIPSDEFFKSYFDDLYAWFSDRFGFLSFPIDLLSRIIDLFVNSSSTDCILTLPSFEISGEQLLQEHSFNLTDFLEENFAFLLSSIRMVSSIGLIMAFVNLCGDKWNEVMRN